MWKLVIEDDEGKRTVVPLTRDDYTIGRKDGNTIRLTERNVSRDHAKIKKKNGAADPAGGDADRVTAYALEDLSSYNGVYVNGLRVVQAQGLVHGDLIQIGDYRIVLQDDAAIEDVPVRLDADDLKPPTPTGPGIPSALRATNAAFLDKPNRLIMLAGPTPGEEYPLTDERLTIGRAEDATISVNHNSVSRLHCEVHALGEGRFEIIDKGSSNGVRVNGADLRRGIIEAGDIIELGDVRFKFVGQGQAFRPGAIDGEQLAAISNRTASMVPGQGRSSVLPAVFLGTLVAATLVAGYAYVSRRRVAESAPPPLVVASADPESADVASLAVAKRLCDGGDYEAAHEKLLQLPEGSSVRGLADFKFIEYSWATMLLLRADTDSDPAAKRARLERVAGAETVDANLRKTASDRLAALDEPAAIALTAIDASRNPIATAGHTGAAHASQSAQASASETRSSQTSPARPAQRVPAASFEVERSLALSSSPADVQRARDLLEPRVFGAKASPDEVRLLEAICKQQHDVQCARQCKSLETGGGP